MERSSIDLPDPALNKKKKSNFTRTCEPDHPGACWAPSVLQMLLVVYQLVVMPCNLCPSLQLLADLSDALQQRRQRRLLPARITALREEKRKKTVFISVCCCSLRGTIYL